MRLRDEFFARLRAGELDFATVHWRTAVEDGWAILGLYGSSPAGAVVQLSVTFSVEDWDPVLCDAAAEQLVVTLERSVGLEPVWGAVVLDRVFAGQTPYDRWTGTGHREAMRKVRGLVRGYYWVNLLSGGHLAHWGGREEARAAAVDAGFLAEDVGEGLLVRCPGPLSAFDDGKLAAVKGFLRPILMPKEGFYFDKYPLRILPD